ncbi:MAG: class I SAM-dependent methyltransferase [Gammaproteobacteria bacterium]
MRLISTLILATAFCLPAFADEATDELIKQALDADIRTEAEKERDANRKPAETLAFFGLTKDMKVLELLPGGGWYTKVLAPVLADDGELYVGVGSGRVRDRLLGEPGFDKVKELDLDPGFRNDGPFNTYNLNPIRFDEKGFDMVLTFRNVHNLTPEARAIINKASFDALKSGGVYGVVDHTARHMEPMSSENRRRLDPIIVIKEALAAGFVFEDFSDVHYRPDDELRYEVGRKSVTGNTDRYTLRFRKP